jgi:hypothetical protein
LVETRPSHGANRTPESTGIPGGFDLVASLQPQEQVMVTTRTSSLAFPSLAVGTLLALPCAQGALAQVVNLSGNVADGAGGPLQAGVVYHAIGHIAVPAGATLTVAAGAIVKSGAGIQLDVRGTLLVNGTQSSPAIFTSIQDDSAGGDTNGNGPSAGTPGDHRGLLFQPTAGASVLRHATVRFSGWGGMPGILLAGADVTLQSCAVTDGSFDGVSLNNGSLPTVADCSFLGNGGVAVNLVPFDAVPGFTDNSATGNAGGDCLRITAGTLTASRTIGPRNVLGGALVFANNADVPAGTTLTLEAGVVAKLQYPLLVFDVHGTLLAQGAPALPVVLTSISDDAHGGDTNRNGPSTGSPADWRGMRFFADSDASVLEHLVVRFAGYGGWMGIQLAQSDIAMRGCTIQSCAWSGLDLFDNSWPQVRECDFRDNGAFAVSQVRLDAVPGFLRNTASGNAAGDYLNVTASPLSSCTIGRANLVNGVLVLPISITVPAGVSVTLTQGVVVKPRSNAVALVVDGGLDLRGSGFEPVVFTSYADDTHGGDTNQDGPSTGAPADWMGMLYRSTTTPSLVEHALLRYGGHAAWPCFQGHSPRTTIRAVRVEFSGDRGFYLSAHAIDHIPNLVAFGCAGDGIQIVGGTFQVQFATSVRNGGAGFRGHPSFQGVIGNSIAWTNGQNFAGFTSLQVVNCNGEPTLAGSRGNVFVVPGFVDEANGNLRLTHNCPMVDQGDMAWASAIVEDHEQNSRILDDDLNSVPVPDRGAYELCWWDMAVGGEPRPGATLDFVVQPHLPYTGISFYAFGWLDGAPFTPFGFALLGTSPVVLGSAPVATPFRFQIPDLPWVVGIEAGIQTLSLPLVAGLYPTITRLYRLKVRP